MAVDDHGECKHCKFDFNGDRIWDKGLEIHGTEEGADRYAEPYGARKGFGRFGKQVYVKPYYGDNFKKGETFFKCPECGGRQ